MGEAESLRGLSRAALLDPCDLADRGVERAYVLTLLEGVLELETTAQGESVVWAYSTIQGLVAACGGGQPYVAASADDIQDFADRLSGPLLVALDVWHPDGARYDEIRPEDLEPLVPSTFGGAEELTVWIPTRPVREGDREVVAELHSIEPGQPLLLVYSSLERLVQNCGPYQAAAAIGAERIDAVAEQAGAHGVVFDAVLDEGARHRAPVRDWARRSHDEFLG